MKTSGNFLSKSKYFLIALLAVSLFSSAFSRPKSDQVTIMRTYLEKSGKEPAQYVISKFKDKDAVILSQFNYLKHEVDFVKSLIPVLREEGITNLAIEYGNIEDQKTIDAIITAPTFNEEAVKNVMLNYREYGIWGYQEYLDIFKAAWDANRFISKKDKKFRIILLTPANGCLKEKNKIITSTIENEVFSKGEKVLIYMSTYHFQNNQKEVVSVNVKSYLNFPDKYKNKVFSIMMHSPRVLQPVSDNGRVELTKPMQGALDEVLEKTGNNPVGFDITGSPFENLKESKTSHNDLSGSNTFKSICDGYIFLMPYHDYEALTWIPDFINEKNLLDVKKYFWSVNSELQIDSIDYANDLCSSVNSSLLKTAKAL